MVRLRAADAASRGQADFQQEILAPSRIGGNKTNWLPRRYHAIGKRRARRRRFLQAVQPPRAALPGGLRENLAEWTGELSSGTTANLGTVRYLYTPKRTFEKEPKFSHFSRMILRKD